MGGHVFYRGTAIGYARAREKRTKTRQRCVKLSQRSGPFRRCITVHVPVWTPIFDVPDITFRVTQDVDGNGSMRQQFQCIADDYRPRHNPADDQLSCECNFGMSGAAVDKCYRSGDRERWLWICNLGL